MADFIPNQHPIVVLDNGELKFSKISTILEDSIILDPTGDLVSVRENDDTTRIKLKGGTLKSLDSYIGNEGFVSASSDYPINNGDMIEFVPVADNTGAVSLSVNGGASLEISNSDGSSLSSGALKAGVTYMIRKGASTYELIGESRLKDIRDSVSNAVAQATSDRSRILALESAQASGVGTPYQLLSDLPASDGSGRTAFVWNDGSNNGYYADVSGGWIRMYETLPADQIERIRNVESVLNQSILSENIPTAYTTIIKSGAKFWDGTQITPGAPTAENSQSSEPGYILETGVDGDGTVIRCISDVSEVAPNLAGQTCLIRFYADTSSAFVSEFDVSNISRININVFQVDGVNQNANPATGETIEQSSANELEFGVTHTFSGNEQQIRVDLSVTSNDPVGSDAYIFVKSSKIIKEKTTPVSELIQNESLRIEQKFRPILEPMKKVSRNFDVTQVALNGATKLSSNGVLIPATQSGSNSKLTIEDKMESGNLSELTGQTVTAFIEFETSDNFLAEMGGGSNDFEITYLDKDNTGGASDPLLNKSVTQVSTNKLELKVDLPIIGNESEIRFDASFKPDAVSTEDRWAKISGLTYILEEAQDIDNYITNLLKSSDDAVFIDDVLDVSEIWSISTNGAKMGTDRLQIDVDAGNTGDGSTLSLRVPLYDIKDGAVLDVITTVEVSSGFELESPLSLQAYVRLTDIDEFRTSGVVSSLDKSGNIITIKSSITREANDNSVEQRLRINGGASRSSNGFMKIKDTCVKLISVPEPYDIDYEAAKYYRSKRLQNALEGDIWKVETVDPFNGGDNLLTMATSLGGGRTPEDKLKYFISPGTHSGIQDNTNHLKPKDWTILSGGGQTRDVLLDFREPDNAPDQSNHHGIFIVNSVEVKDLTIWTKDSRYFLHIDPGAEAQPENIRIENVRGRHFGNTGDNAWQSPSGIGMGTCTGLNIVFFGVDSQAPKQSCGIHDNVDFLQGNSLTFQYCSFSFDNQDGQSLGLPALAQGHDTSNDVLIEHVNFAGIVSLSKTKSLSLKRESYPTNFCPHKVRVAGPALPFTVDQPYKGLVLRSRPVLGSSIKVTGFPLFDNAVPEMGGVGSGAFIVSLFAVEPDGIDDVDASTLALSTVLGDKTSSPETVNIEFEDVSVSLVLDADFSFMTNQQVADWLNTELDSQGAYIAGQREFTIDTPWEGWADIRQPDSEDVDINRDDSVIGIGDLLWRVDGGVRKAKSTDFDKRFFAGVSMTRSIPGERVIYQRKDRISEQSCSRLVSRPSFGDLYTWGDDGSMMLTDDRNKAVLECIRTHSSVVGSSILRFVESLPDISAVTRISSKGYAYAEDWDNGEENGWTAVRASLQVSQDGLTVTQNDPLNDSMTVRTPEISIDGSKFDTVIVEVTIHDTASDFSDDRFVMFWASDNFGFSESRKGILRTPAAENIGQRQYLSFDAGGSPLGGDIWSSEIITDIRLDLLKGDQSSYTIHSFSVVSSDIVVVPGALRSIEGRLAALESS